MGSGWPRTNGTLLTSSSIVLILLLAAGINAGSGYVAQSQESPVLQKAGGSIATLSPSPSARTAAGMVYDAKDRYFVLFGGFNSSTGCSGGSNAGCGDTWTFSAGKWTELKLKVAPSPRGQMGMVYNAATGRVILFGGIAATSGYNFNDTWVFSHGVWKNITASAGSPPGRHGQVMTYDARDGYVLMFGGSHRCCGGQPSIGDTWKFQFGLWTQIGSCGGPSQASCASSAPSPRLHSMMTYDAADKYVLLFGGGNNTQNFGDTWTYAGGTWTNLTAKIGGSPHPLSDGAMAYSSALGRAVLFGGAGSTSKPTNQTWE